MIFRINKYQQIITQKLNKQKTKKTNSATLQLAAFIASTILTIVSIVEGYKKVGKW